MAGEGTLDHEGTVHGSAVRRFCGSASVADPDPGSGIRDPVPVLPPDPGYGMGKKSGSGSGIQDEQLGSYYQELRNHFWGLKYLNSLMRIWDGNNWDPGSGMEKSRIRDLG